jgi:sugar/nucleoside kinase (ribokinase family)
VAELFRAADSKARQGGGSVHGITQEDVRGGNAVNLAHALARLGSRVLLITHSDPEHVGMLREAFDGLDAELSIKPMPPGLTLSIEGNVNVMLSDSGGAADFPPSLLTKEDWAALRKADIVCSVNWSSNRYGTELLTALRRKLGPQKTLFLNPSDVRDRFVKYAELVRSLQSKHLVDWVSLNEYEAEATAEALGVRTSDPRRACLEISRRIHVRVDVHTEKAVHTSSGTKVVSAKTNPVRARRLTGAGDAWDAASLTAELKGMDDRSRLEFANAAARLYVKSSDLSPPTFSDVRKALG